MKKSSIRTKKNGAAGYLKPLLLLGIILFGSLTTFSQKNRLKPSDWKLAVQSYTFRMFTFAEALDKADSAGIKFVEGFPGQKIGGGIEGTLTDQIDEATQKKVLAMLKAKGMKLISFGVISPKTDEEWSRLFKFAKAMGIENITSEPKEEQIPLISKLCDEYGINVAIHNHPKPSHYWEPQVVLAAIKNASPRVGACADVGHWIRSGLDPIECLKMLEGHVIQFHMKDLNEKGVRTAHDLPWGTGISNIRAIMEEMKRQKFKGVVSIEYEYNWYNSTPEVKASAEYFNKQKEILLKK